MNQLITILSDFINERATTIDFNDYHLAELHEVSAIVSYQCKKSDSSIAFQAFRFANQKHAVAALEESIKEFPYIIVKGYAIKELYPVKELRTMGDIDVLIHEKDVNRVIEKLVYDGFKFIDSGDDEYIFSKNGLNFEIHTQLIHDGPGKEKLVTYFDDAWRYQDHDGHLDWNYHFLYLLAHLRGHFVAGGVGLRQFVDIALLEKNINLDWAWITGEARKIDLYDFLSVVLAFIERWFEIKSPVPTELDSIFFEKGTEDIINNGVFGRNNQNNKGNMVSRLAVNTEVSARKAKLKFFISKAFPNLGYMRKVPYCSYLIKYSFLLPFAWVHRIVYRMANSKSRTYVKEEVFVPNAKIDKRITYLKQWGL